MSTKINVRSPFYLNLTEPTIPQPTFACSTASVTNLSIDQQGQISTPSLAYGEVDSITSTDAGFSNGKFSTVSTATIRTLTLRILIPSGFSNSEDGYIDCSYDVTQPAYISGTTCSGGPTTSGSISSQSLDVDGDSTTIDLSSYFTAGTDPIAGYTISNTNTTLVNTSVSGSTLTISSNTLGGSATIHVSAYDDGSNTCTATQSFSVSVSSPTTAFSCSIANLTGGSIAQDGTITEPNTAADITAIKETSGGSSITSYDANDTGSDRSVTLYFDLTAPAGYSNGGSTIECSKTFTQPAGDPEFTCEVANLSGQKIATNGSITKGSASLGTITDWSPKDFDPVSTDTARTVTFTVSVPSGYSNSGTISCSKTITQPADIPTCGTNNFYITKGLTSTSQFCDGMYSASTYVQYTVSQINIGGGVVCGNGSKWRGENLYYGVSESRTLVGENLGRFKIWKIDNNGIVQEVLEGNCGSTSTGDSGLNSGRGKFGSL